MADTSKTDFLKDEYILLQNLYEDFDRRNLTIKGWAVTISIGAIALAFQYSSPELLWLSILSSFLFWIVESIWKSLQKANDSRIQKIEKHFKGEEENIYPFQIFNSWVESYRSKSFLQQVWENAFWQWVYIPHLIIILIAIALLMINYFISPIFVVK